MPAAIAFALVLALSPQLSTKLQTVKTAKKDFYTTSVTTPVFGGSPLAAYASTQLSNIGRKGVSDWMKDSFPGTSINEKPRLQYYYDASPVVSLATPQVISIYFNVETFTAGAHGMRIYDPHTYAFLNGKPTEIHAKDIFKPGIDYKTLVSNIVIGKLMVNDRAEWVQNGQVKELTSAQVESFVVTPSGLTYLFDPYDMGPYAVGTFEVKIPFAEFLGQVDTNGPLKSLLTK